ncbi:hypothetical protein HNP02_003470 [Mycobacterium sp. AZCC_0083]|nr:hypothetical protein [Mycobacterium sp. AZCC_0083]
MSSSMPTMLVYLWWMKLCDFFQCTLGEVVSHSHSVEWISGSFIQSHCPWVMLCPSSMFSMILAVPSMAVPATQATLFRLAKRAIRPAAASPRCSWMDRRM